MSTDETSTEETVEETTEASEEVAEETQESSADPINVLTDMQQLEVKIVRFSRLRDALLDQDKKWAEEHTAKRIALLEEAGLLEQFKEMDAEVAEHRAQFKANVDPITASIQVLSEYRMSKIQGTEFAQMETLEKVWTFEEQVFSGVQKAQEDQEASVEEPVVEETEEKSEE